MDSLRMKNIFQFDWIWILATIAVIALGLYRRGKHLIGHQRYNATRMGLRIGILAGLLAWILVQVVMYLPQNLPGAVAGGLVGLGVGALATRFSAVGNDAKGSWYVPNIWLGIGLIALLIGRYLYEIFYLLPQMRALVRQASQTGKESGILAFTVHPLLEGILFLVVCYYLANYLGIMIRIRRLPPAKTTT